MCADRLNVPAVAVIFASLFFSEPRLFAFPQRPLLLFCPFWGSSGKAVILVYYTVYFIPINKGGRRPDFILFR